MDVVEGTQLAEEHETSVEYQQAVAELQFGMAIVGYSSLVLLFASYPWAIYTLYHGYTRGIMESILLTMYVILLSFFPYVHFYLLPREHARRLLKEGKEQYGKFLNSTRGHKKNVKYSLKLN